MCLGGTGTRLVVRDASHALKSGCVWQYLEWREKQYDLRVRVDVFGRESAEEPIVRGALTYIASDDRVKNGNYAGASCQTCSGTQLSFPSVLHDAFAPATKVLCITSEECWAYAHCGRSRHSNLQTCAEVLSSVIFRSSAQGGHCIPDSLCLWSFGPQC